MSSKNKQTKRKKINVSTEFKNIFDSVITYPSSVYCQYGITSYILNFCQKNNLNYIIDTYGNIIIDKRIYNYCPFVMAHLDTVHTYDKGFNVYQSNGIYTARDNNKKQVGIGGDDKCGVAVCLNMLLNIDNIVVMFFTGEETGGTGSGGVNIELFNNASMLISVDRWGNSDIINNYCMSETINKEMITILNDINIKHGYKYNNGMFTDSFNIQDRGVGISAINISCGYYQHHTNTEYIDINETYICYLYLCDLCNILENKQYIHTPLIFKNSNHYDFDSFYTSSKISNKDVYF